jgi:putative transposase
MSVARRREMVEASHPHLSIVRQCALLQISRSGRYYQPVGESEPTLALMRLIDEAFLECPYYGSRQMMRHLHRLGHQVGRNWVARLMRKMGLRAIYQKPNTSAPHPEHRVYPYLLRDLAIVRPNQVWCSDVTYIPMRRGFLYLVAIMDWHSRRVLSWRLSNTMDVTFCTEALEEALARHGKPGIFNTDQGSQPIHQPVVHPSADGRRHPDQYRWPRSLDGQCFHRAAMAVVEVRERLPACVRDGPRAACWAAAVDRLWMAV